jgi:hypothetical protein
MGQRLAGIPHDMEPQLHASLQMFCRISRPGPMSTTPLATAAPFIVMNP